MSSIESWIVPDTVQLIVEVAGLCSSAPALEVMRPAGIAPRRSAHRKRSYQCSRTSSRFDVRERARDALVGVVHRLVDGRAVLGGEPVFLVPDVERCFLEWNRVDVFGFDLHDSVHVIRGAPNILDALSNGLQGISGESLLLPDEPRALPGTRCLVGSQAPVTSPDRVTLIAFANTRSCVGVRRLITEDTRVKIRNHIL